MNGSPSASPRSLRARAALALVCALVVGFYFWRCDGTVSELGRDAGKDAYYNLLVAGFESGQLHLKTDVPPGLRELPDPYDPKANQPYRKAEFAPLRLHDTSYYEGKLHLYFGVTPALLLFWPFHALTGQYVTHAAAVAVFCSLGFLIGVWLLRDVARRCFPEAPPWVLVAGASAFGLANSVPVMMWRPEVWEVPISCAFMLVMLSLAAVWRALNDEQRAARWVAAGSIAYALAIAARPSVLPAAVVLLVPLGMAARRHPREQRRGMIGRLLAALIIPMLVVGVGVALYNYLRFADPLEFGQRYQLAGDRQDNPRHFSLSYAWYNFRLYFLAFAGWRETFPFFGDVRVPPMPPGHGDVDMPYGILTNTPVTLFALGAVFAWRRGAAEMSASLRALIVALVLLFAVNAALLLVFYGTCTRYQVEFHPPLVLLAVVALLAVSAHAGRVPWAGRFVTTAWVCCLGYSAAFGALKSFQGLAANFHARGIERANAGDSEAALRLFEQAIHYGPERLDPRFYAAVMAERLGRIPEAISHLEELVRIAPQHAIAQNNLGQLLRQAGRPADAVAHFQAAVRERPDFFEAFVNLGATLQETGRHAEAVESYRRALALRADFAEVRYWLSLSLRALGRTQEARGEYEEARRMKPELPPLSF